MMFDGIIELTSAYTNALLLAVLPHVSDFSERLKLDVSLPVTVSHVQAFGAFRTDIGASLSLTNGMVFSFDRGRVGLFRTAARQRELAEGLAITATRLQLDRAAAVEVARAAVRDLGYDLESVYADLEPVVTEPKKLRGRLYPVYRIVWYKPNLADREVLEAQVNGATGRLEELFLVSRETWKTPLRVPVEPTIKAEPVRKRNLSDAEARQLMVRMLPECELFAAKLDLPVARPITLDQVKQIVAWRVGDAVRASMVLTNGYALECDGTSVDGFSAPDVFFGGHHVRVREFVGTWVLTKRQAIALARETVKKVASAGSLTNTRLAPVVTVPYLRGAQSVPRYAIVWQPEESPEGSSCVVVEVDAARGRVTALNCRQHVVQAGASPSAASASGMEDLE